MSSTGNIEWASPVNGYYFRVTMTQVERDDANNRSKIAWTIWQYKTVTAYDGLMDRYLYINAGGNGSPNPGFVYGRVNDTVNFHTGYAYNTWYQWASGTTGWISHSVNGTGTIGAEFYWSGSSGGYGPGTVGPKSLSLVLDRCPLAPPIVGLTADTITSSSARIGTEISSFGHGTSAACRIYYRTYPSGGWIATSDQNDAPGYNYFTINGLSPYQTYEYKAYWWNNNGDSNYSSTQSFTTLGYANYTNGSPYCETIHSSYLNVAVCVDVTCDLLQLKVDGGSWTNYFVGDWVGWKVVTVTGLSTGTQHSFQTRIRRKDSQLTKDSSVFYGTTTSHATITSATGNINDTATSVTISFTNPTSTPVSVWLELPDINASSYKVTNNATSPATLTLDSTTKNLILAAMTSVKSTKLRYVVHDSLDGVDTWSFLDYTITIVNANPTFTTFTYLDTNTDITSVTGNNQYLLQDYSTLRATISSANKAVALKGATMSRYTFNINGLNESQTYSASDINKDLGIVTAATNQILTVEAIDSRGNKTSVVKTINMIPYSLPVINATVTRLNDFEEDTTLTVDGTFSRATILNIDKNTIEQDKVNYRYKRDDGAYSDWIEMARQLDVGEFTTANEYLTLDNTISYTFEISVEDKFDTKTVTAKVDRGKPIFMISGNLNSIGVGQIPTEEDVLEVSEDILIKSSVEARDHYDGSKPRVVNVCYGTSATPPSATTTPGGTIYIQYSE